MLERSEPRVHPLSEAFAEIREGLTAVEAEMDRIFATGDPLLAELAGHLQRAGGKRLRPALLFLTGSHYDAPGGRLLPVATAVELIHMATLVHDDIVDGAETRRGLRTINARYGEGVSVLLGDFLFASAFDLLARTGDNRLVQGMARVVAEMSVGEFEQMAQQYDLECSEEQYLLRVRKKTASFIAECCRLGALVAGVSEGEAQCWHEYGMAIGIGYQILDDILDLTGTPGRLGKPIGSDLRAGLYTLPVLHALRQPEGERLRELLRERPLADGAIEEVRALVDQAGGFGHAYRFARERTREGIASLRRVRPGPFRDRLERLAEELVRRES